MSGALDENLGRVLVREVPGCIGLVSTERLSGGASQETYKLTVTTVKGTRLLCLRRAPGGPEAGVDSDLQESIGLPTEALLISKALAALVPEPKVHYVLRESDSLGEGFVMEWLEGETLGSRIVRSGGIQRPSAPAWLSNAARFLPVSTPSSWRRVGF
ncbi:MAG: hypothetical protein CM1200mP9_07540 [Gammaproteobacteria bacterium]|nr:MAG: hypothetical protein CM1200mP9_07540 [Gammaproteobacteria bacterium]